MIDKNKLEKILLANWTKFINYKNLLPFIEKSKSIKLSRFELVDDGFIIWIEFDSGTTELKIHNNGSTHHIQTIKKN